MRFLGGGFQESKTSFFNFSMMLISRTSGKQHVHLVFALFRYKTFFLHWTIGPGRMIVCCFFFPVYPGFFLQ